VAVTRGLVLGGQQALVEADLVRSKPRILSLRPSVNHPSSLSSDDGDVDDDDGDFGGGGGDFGAGGALGDGDGDWDGDGDSDEDGEPAARMR